MPEGAVGVGGKEKKKKTHKGKKEHALFSANRAIIWASNRNLEKKSDEQILHK